MAGLTLKGNDMEKVHRSNFRNALAGLIILAAASVSAGRAQCPLTLSPVTYAPVQQLSIADIDFEHFESHTLLFTLEVKNSSGSDVQTQLQVTLDIMLANGTLNERVLDLMSDPFTIGSSGRTITNLQMGRGGDIEFHNVTLPQDAREKVQDVALATGKFPAGTYTFRFALVNTECGTLPAEPPVVFVVQNPSRVELRSPRDGEVTNEFPLFEFFLDNSDWATLTVAEKDPDQSRDEAIVRQPPMLEVDLTGQNAFPYSGGRPLEDGKSYVWRIVSKTRSPGGTDLEVSSPIGLFTVSASGAASPQDALLNQLEEMLGRRYPGIFKEIRDGGFTLTGQYELNSSSLSRAEVLDLLLQLREMSDTIDLTLE